MGFLVWLLGKQKQVSHNQNPASKWSTQEPCKELRRSAAVCGRQPSSTRVLIVAHMRIHKHGFGGLQLPWLPANGGFLEYWKWTHHIQQTPAQLQGFPCCPYNVQGIQGTNQGSLLAKDTLAPGYDLWSEHQQDCWETEKPRSCAQDMEKGVSLWRCLLEIQRVLSKTCTEGVSQYPQQHWPKFCLRNPSGTFHLWHTFCWQHVKLHRQKYRHARAFFNTSTYEHG